MQQLFSNCMIKPLFFELSDLSTCTPTWAKEAIDEFEFELGKQKSDFPCTFGIQNYKEKSLRFVFIENNEPEHLNKLVESLREYTKQARNFGSSSSSLVCVFKPLKNEDIRAYELWFWNILQYLHDNDSEPWPLEYSNDPEHETWAFCFAGEGHFVVCNTPEHSLRRSRRSSVPMITFTPRWGFKGIEGNTKPGIAVRELIRKRVTLYDKVPPSSDFSAFGHGLDWVQYFLPDDNETRPLEKCPFHTIRFPNKESHESA